MAKKFTPTKIGKFDIFHGRQAHTRDTWFVYDTEEKEYTGGAFDHKKDAMKYAKGKQ